MEPIEEHSVETVRPVRSIDPVAPGQPAATEVYRHSATIIHTPNHRLERAIWFAVGLIDALIAIRFSMRLLGASNASPFVNFIYGVSSPLVAPFRGIFPESGQATYVLEPAAIVAILIYALIGWALIALVRIISAPRGSRPAA